MIVYCSVSQTFLFHIPLFTLDTSFRPPSSAGFTYRLYKLKPRASRSKGASENCGTLKVNGRYMII